MVKDLRNKIESTNPSSVLDGNIDQFIEEGIKNSNEKSYISLVILFFLLSYLIVVLSTIGIKTNKFNNLILIK